MDRTWIAATDFLLWPAIELGISRLSFEIPERLLEPGSALFRPFSVELSPGFYNRVFGLRLWRRYLPDGGAWFRMGFSKARLAGLTPEYLSQFARETCRGELAHWLMIACTPVFFLFNPPWADGVMVGFALASNVPCILSQRRVRAGLVRRNGRRK